MNSSQRTAHTHKEPPNSPAMKNTTLDASRQAKEEYFADQDSSLHEKRDTLQRIKGQPKLCPSTKISERARLKDTIESLTAEIDRIESCVDSFDYYSQTHEIFDAYYVETNCERPQKISFEHGGIVVKSSSDTASKADLFEQYTSIVNHTSIRKPATDSCSNCGHQVFINHSDALLVCPSCHLSEYVLMESHTPAYGEHWRKQTYPYKRINHLNSLLKRFQSNPNTPDISHEDEDNIRDMFSKMQVPFQQACPANRHNFLSYNYVLHKLCEIIGLKSIAAVFLC